MVCSSKRRVCPGNFNGTGKWNPLLRKPDGERMRKLQPAECDRDCRECRFMDRDNRYKLVHHDQLVRRSHPSLFHQCNHCCRVDKLSLHRNNRGGVQQYYDRIGSFTYHHRIKHADRFRQLDKQRNFHGKQFNRRFHRIGNCQYRSL